MPVINAGSGSDQHPTQALLDIYTLDRSFEARGGIDGKVIGMMGDLKRGRTVRSLCYLMRHYEGVRLVFIAPPQFAMDVKFLRTELRHDVDHGTEREELFLEPLDFALNHTQRIFHTLPIFRGRIPRSIQSGINSK